MPLMTTGHPYLPVRAPAARNKVKFQADLAPADDRAIRLLKEELQLDSNSDFLADAVALFRWAVTERRSGHRIVSETISGERTMLLFPRLERVAPDVGLPVVDIEWTDEQLSWLGDLLAAPDVTEPTAHLIRAMRR